MQLVMSARQVEDDEGKWLATRRPLITATKIGVIMRLDGAHLTGEFAQSPRSVWMEMTGRTDPADGPRLPPRRVMFGKYCENWTAWELGEARPDLHVAPGGLYIDSDRPWMGATFDRLAHSRDTCPPGKRCSRLIQPAATVQLKTDVRDFEREGIPLAYWAQCIWEAHIARARSAYLVVLDKVNDEVRIFTIDMDEETDRELALMIQAGADFLELVRTDTRPEIDWLPATTEALYQMHPNVDKEQAARIPLWLWRAWRHAAARREAADQRRLLYKNMIIERVGGAGRIVIRHPVTGRLTTVGYQRSGPRAAYHVEAKETVRSINPSTAKDLPL